MVRRLPNGLLKYDYEEVRQMGQFCQNIHYRLHNRDQNFVMALTGGTGTGKSFGGLQLCYTLDPNFTVEKNVIFDPLDFVELVNSKDTYQGMMVLWEEVGVGIDSKKWYAPINRAIGHVVQTFRKKHMGVVMTVPNASFFDGTVRKLLNAYGEMEDHIDRQNNKSKMRIYIPKYSYRFKKEYFAAPQYNLKRENRPFRVEKLVFPKVPDEIAKEYEKKRAEFMKSKGIEIEEDMREAMNQGKRKLTPKEIAIIIANKPDDFYNEKGDIDVAAIQLKYDTNRTYAAEIKRMAKRLMSPDFK